MHYCYCSCLPITMVPMCISHYTGQERSKGVSYEFRLEFLITLLLHTLWGCITAGDNVVGWD